MNVRRLGSSELMVSVLGLGTNNFGLRDDVAANDVVDAALDHGVNFFDTAASYGNGKSEEALGAALVGKRQSAIIASKWGTTRNPPPGMGTREFIHKSCEASLNRLRTDYIDVYHLHATDPVTPIAETILACDELVQQGKIRYYGLSSAASWRIAEAQLTATLLGKSPFIATQEHYSVLRRDIVEGEKLEVIQKYNLGLVPYFPLASGLLTGKYDRNRPHPEGSRFAVIEELGRAFTTGPMWTATEKLTQIAANRGHSIIELALSWLIQQPAVSSVITGATSRRQLLANINSIGWKMDDATLSEIDACRPLLAGK